MENVYKTMRNTGAANIAIGIIMIVTGLSAGTLAIVTGANLLKKKSQLTFQASYQAVFFNKDAAVLRFHGHK